MIKIRRVKERDVHEVLNIYRPYIETAITFEYEVPSVEEFSQRIHEISAEYPYLICEVDGNIVGYAYAHRFKEREAYQWDAELSIYIDNKYNGKGIGKVLYNCILDILKLQNIKNVYAIVTKPNVKSERLHKSFGFNIEGVHRNTGYKCGKWHDVIYFQKSISDYDSTPKKFKSISEIDDKLITDILNINQEKIS